ncbi:MAG: AI-2E family transporter [Hymenobacteraceae bacterium]|nr:AI-2E family transporter [Hymenobacteraceae bacterium]MDX5483163.1 AI-2E family transporter [Hymenobacteraceae bacterium]
MTYDALKRANAIIIFALGTLTILYLGEGFLIPLVFAIFLTTLMKPVANKLEGFGVPRMLSSVLCTLAVFVFAAGLSGLLVDHLKVFVNDLPVLQDRLEEILGRLQGYMSRAFGISSQMQHQLLEQRSDAAVAMLQSEATKFMGSLLSTSLKFLLMLVYLFLLLANRDKYDRFILMYTPREKDAKAKHIMNKTEKVASQYLWGRLKVMTILAAMYLITFVIFDVQYMVLLTVFGAIVTVIPYIGPFISGVLPILIVILMGESFGTILTFASIILVIQLIESYVLEPYIIGAEIKLSPLAVIIAVVVGGTIWGVAGMILFVPITAILKIMFDQSKYLRPVGYLIGSSGSKADKDK